MRDVQIQWEREADATRDVFNNRGTRVVPQGQDGTAHFNYFDEERQLSFQWDGNMLEEVVVSYGGYGEPIKWTFAFRDHAGGYLKPDTPHGWTRLFQVACDNWIEAKEDAR